MSGIIGSAGSKSGVIGTTELDYEEGVFSAELRGQTARADTPVIANNTGGLIANYIKVGNLVHFDIYFGNVNMTGATGQLQITDFPFTAATDHVSSPTIGFCVSMDFPTNNIPVLSLADTTINASVMSYVGGYGDWVPTYGTTRYFRCSGTYSLG